MDKKETMEQMVAQYEALYKGFMLELENYPGLKPLREQAIVRFFDAHLWMRESIIQTGFQTDDPPTVL